MSCLQFGVLPILHTYEEVTLAEVVRDVVILSGDFVCDQFSSGEILKLKQLNGLQPAQIY